jgi:hypothetical protein
MGSPVGKKWGRRYRKATLQMQNGTVYAYSAVFANCLFLFIFRLNQNINKSVLVPRRGLEPPRSYPLVPETSASTNSATWACTFTTKTAIIALFESLSSYRVVL